MPSQSAARISTLLLVRASLDAADVTLQPDDVGGLCRDGRSDDEADERPDDVHPLVIWVGEGVADEEQIGLT
jgi:hypothetical protein